MILVNLTAGASTVGTNLPFEVAWNTNGNLAYSENDATITIKAPGIYEIYGTCAVTSSGTLATGIGVYNDGELIGNASVYVPGAANETTTLPIYTVVQVVTASTSDFVTLSLRATGTPTIANGQIVVRKIQ